MKEAAQMIEEKGEELLLILSDTLDKLNQSVHSKASNTGWYFESFQSM